MKSSKNILVNIPPITLLFFSSLVILMVGMGLFPVLPFYAAQFGAGPGLTGLFFALISAFLSAGSLMAGSLAERFSIKKVFIGSGLLGIPALILLGQATDLYLVMLLTSAVWFLGGLNLALINMLLGMTVRKEARGRAFTFLSLCVPLGALLGGAGVGALVAEVGYSLMFVALGLLWCGVPLAGSLLPAIESDSPGQMAAQGTQRMKFYNLSEPFAGVVIISFIAAIAIHSGRLGTPLLMQVNAFEASEVASSAMVGGLIAIPFVLMAGGLSDRVSRTRSLMVAYLFASAGIVVLVFASQLWHYWLSSSFIMVAVCLNGALATAVATDVLPPWEMKRGLAWLNAVIPGGSILAYAGTGFLVDIMGYRVFYLALTILPILAAALLETALRRCRKSMSLHATPVLEHATWEENAYIKRCLQ